MKPRLFCFFLMVCVILLPVPSFSHGTKGTVQNGGLVVAATYDDGKAIDYAKVTISAPGAKLPFQSGRTDRNGRFCFFPDGAGEWKVVVDDEMGHRLEIMVPVNEELVFQTSHHDHEHEAAELSRTTKAAVGISIIFGTAGLYFWWAGRRRAGHR